MAESIKGAKSKIYVKDQVPGSTVESSDTMQHVTVQELTGGKAGMDVVIHGVYQVNTVVKTVDAGSVRRKLVITAHGARRGDYLRFDTGAAIGEEVSVVGVEDANTLYIAQEVNASIGDEVLILRHITPSYNDDGSLNVLASQGPVQFRKDGVITETSYDTATPSNSEALPVNIVTVNGQGVSTTVDLTGAQINVQLSDRGVSPDAVRVGDGTNLMGVNASLEALTHDQGAIDLLTTIDSDTSALRGSIAADGGAQPTNGVAVAGHTGSGTIRHLKVDNGGVLETNVASSALPSGAATSANQATEITALGNILTELQLKADLTETQPVSIAGTVAVSGPLTDAELRNTPVPVSGGFLTDTQLRATAVPVSGPLTDTELRATAVPVSGPLTDVQLRATAVPVSGNVTANKNYITGTLKVNQITVGLTEVRATTDGFAPSATRQKLRIKPSKNNTGAMFIIATGGSITTGMEIIGPDFAEFEYDPTDYYLISDTAAQTVEILEVE